MTQVDPDLTKVNVLRLSSLNVNLGPSQPTPLKENLVPRFDNKIRAIPSNMTRVTKGARHIRLHLSTTRIQLGQKIYGALLTASTPLMRKRAMNVYVKN
jgi:hypothetical protein